MMTVLLSLIIHSVINPLFPALQSSLTVTGVIGLPFSVSTAAWAVPTEDKLILFINRPGERKTIQLHVLPNHQINQLNSLPVVAAGAVRCDHEVIVTGTNQDGRTQVLGVGLDGQIVWQFEMDEPALTRWPVPGCLSHPVIFWQRSPERIELANVGSDGLKHHRSFKVGGPPLKVAVGNNSLWAIWSNHSGIQGIKVGDQTVQDINMPTSLPQDIAIDTYAGRTDVAWVQDNQVFLMQIDSNLKLGSPASVILQGFSNGNLSVVSGTEPLLWLQHQEFTEGEPSSWQSILMIPSYNPIKVEGVVYAVTWWKESIVIIGSEEIRLLRQTVQ